MAYCTDCGSSIPDGSLHCSSCGAKQPLARHAMPALDLNEERNPGVYSRMESFPPLFETEQPKKRVKAEPVSTIGKVLPKPKTFKLRRAVLAALLTVIIVLGAVAGVYALMPQIKGLDEQPAVFLSDDKLYVTRGSEADESCLVKDLGDEFELLKSEEDRQKAALELRSSIYYDKKDQVLYFEDLSSNLYSVSLGKLRGGKDISEKVELIAHNVRASGENEGLVTSGITVLGADKGVIYISDDDSSLCIAKEGKKKVIAEDVDLYAVSPEGAYVVYLCNNAAVSIHKQYTMYICSLESVDELIKIDSRVSSVEHIKGEFEQLWYTRYDEKNEFGPISVWVSGRNIEKEAVLENVYSCEGFSDEGFYYSLAEEKFMLCADYVKDVPEDDAEYEQYKTVRDVLGRTTADSLLQSVYFWSESGATLISENVASWQILNANLAQLTVCDYEQIEKIDISTLKSAYTVVEYLSNAEALGIKAFSSHAGRAFAANNLVYACVDEETGKTYFIDSEDRSLYSCTPTREGFGPTVRVAGDVYGAAWWAEEACAVFVRDYNENTRLCDLYVETEDKISQISYNVMLPDTDLILCGGKTLLYMVGSESTAADAPAQLCYYRAGESKAVGQEVKSFAGADSERIFYVCLNEDGSSELYCTDAADRPVAENPVFVCAPGAGQELEIELFLFD